MRDNQVFTLEADISIAGLALKVVDAYGCPAAAAGAWRSHDWWIDLHELRRWRHVGHGHLVDEALDLRIASGLDGKIWRGREWNGPLAAPAPAVTPSEVTALTRANRAVLPRQALCCRARSQSRWFVLAALRALHLMTYRRKNWHLLVGRPRWAGANCSVGLAKLVRQGEDAHMTDPGFQDMLASAQQMNEARAAEQDQAERELERLESMVVTAAHRYVHSLRVNSKSDQRVMLDTEYAWFVMPTTVHISSRYEGHDFYRYFEHDRAILMLETTSEFVTGILNDLGREGRPGAMGGSKTWPPLPHRARYRLDGAAAGAFGAGNPASFLLDAMRQGWGVRRLDYVSGYQDGSAYPVMITPDYKSRVKEFIAYLDARLRELDLAWAGED
jgi:hypothetical protein